jgi:hypothetical protein
MVGLCRGPGCSKTVRSRFDGVGLLVCRAERGLGALGDQWSSRPKGMLKLAPVERRNRWNQQIVLIRGSFGHENDRKKRISLSQIARRADPIEWGCAVATDDGHAWTVGEDVTYRGVRSFNHMKATRP